MNQSKFLDLAVWLRTNKQCEEGFRTSISRAYYSAFLEAQSLLSGMGVVFPRDTNKHRKIPELLKAAGDPGLRYAGEKLGQLREHRNDADYEMYLVDPEQEPFARLRCDEAQRIVGELKACRTSRGIAGGRYEKARVVVMAAAPGILARK